MLSQRARLLYGLSEDTSFTFTEMARMVEDEHLQNILSGITKAVETKTYFCEEYPIMPMDGSPRRWVKIYGKPYYDEKGKATYITGVVQHISK